MNTTAYADQFRAAARDAFGQLHALAAIEPEASMDYVPLTPGTWLRDQAAGLIASIEAGTAEYCVHIGHSPQVACAAAWAPGRIMCPRCFPTLRPAPEQDFTCDVCGHPHDTIIPTMAAFGPILFAYGHCDHCLTTG